MDKIDNYQPCCSVVNLNLMLKFVNQLEIKTSPKTIKTKTNSMQERSVFDVHHVTNAERNINIFNFEYVTRMVFENLASSLINVFKIYYCRFCNKRPYGTHTVSTAIVSSGPSMT